MRPDLSNLRTIAAACAVGITFAGAPAIAATLLIDDNGILLGAMGLDNGGSFYDVALQ